MADRPTPSGAGEEDFREHPDQRPIKRERTAPTEFVREVRGELRKVAWPGRHEVTNYTLVVIVATMVLIGIVFVMDFVFGRLVFFIFD